MAKIKAAATMLSATNDGDMESDPEFEARRRDWDINHSMIQEAFYNHLYENRKFPTYDVIAKQLDMNEKTIRRHLKEMDVFSDLKLKLKLMTEKSLITIGVKAAQGEGVGWNKLFHELVDKVGVEVI